MTSMTSLEKILVVAERTTLSRHNDGFQVSCDGFYPVTASTPEKALDLMLVRMRSKVEARIASLQQEHLTQVKLAERIE